MWPKSVTALLWGLVLSISLTLNINKLSPLARDVDLLLGVLLGFSLWAGTMVYCYSRDTARQANIACLKVFLVSVSLNAYFVLI